MMVTGTTVAQGIEIGAEVGIGRIHDKVRVLASLSIYVTID